MWMVGLEILAVASCNDYWATAFLLGANYFGCIQFQPCYDSHVIICLHRIIRFRMAELVFIQKEEEEEEEAAAVLLATLKHDKVRRMHD